MPINIGNKARTLVELRSAGFNIPRFLSFDCSEKLEEVERQVRSTHHPQQHHSTSSSHEFIHFPFYDTSSYFCTRCSFY